MKLALLAALTLAGGLASGADADVLPQGCEVRLILVAPGTSDSCTYSAVGTSGTHTIQPLQGSATTEVVCTTGSSYLGQPAPRRITVSFDRTGTCTLTLTVFGASTASGTASAD